MIYPFDLQLFADGGAGDGGAGAGAGATGVTSQAAAANTGVNGAAAGHQGTQPQVQQDSAAAWQEAKSKYKAQYDADVQQIVRSRLKESAAHQQTLQTLQPMLDAMATQMGLKAGDYQAMVDKYMDSDELYEAEAIETGRDVETVKEMRKLRTERDTYKQQVEQRAQQQQFQEHFDQVMQQAAALQQRYPAFDINAAMQDDRFVRLTAPGSGLTVEQAWAALHHDEMQAYAMQAAAQQSQRIAAGNVQANMARPRENAGRVSGPQAAMAPDFSNLTLQQIQQNSRLAQMGRKIIPGG
nr:MAG TPA_asm: Transcription initiation factor TFIID subunit, DNA, Nuclear [Caudoviricetes sp.]